MYHYHCGETTALIIPLRSRVWLDRKRTGTGALTERRKHDRREDDEDSPDAVNSASRCSVLLAITFTLSVAVCSHPSPVEVPFELCKSFGLILIKAEVNGKPAVMVLDTGSNETIISPRLVIVKKLSSKDEVALAKGSGYSGNGVIATAFIGIGPLNPKSCQILVVDLADLSKTLGQQVDGILGMSVLKEFEIVSVDFRHRKLVLE